ncbi:hypothetical protein [Cellulomonas sp.]|uniref:hypothetical protein n=1 Tax=Cellulomonas sp. TaxID=40001 RepID=UPI003BAAA654
MTLDDLRAATAGYRPNGAGRDTWDEIGPFVRDAVVNGACTSLSGTYVTLRAMTSFVVWARGLGMPLDKEVILDEATVERFVATGMPGMNNGTRATYASTLRRVGKAWTVRAYWSPDAPRFPHTRLAPPFTAAEIDRLWDVAATQQTPGRSRGALALMSLAWGAGLKAHEVAAVRAEHVEVRGDVVLVHVGGARARTVPVLPRAHAALLNLCSDYPDRQLFADITASRTAASQVSRHIEIPPRAPAMDSPRLRTTWFVALLNAGLRLSEVFAYSGMQSTSGLRDILRYIERREDAVVFDDIARWSA